MFFYLSKILWFFVAPSNLVLICLGLAVLAFLVRRMRLGAILASAGAIAYGVFGFLPLHVWFLTWPLAKISAMLPISMGGIGVREVALAVLLGRFGIPFSSAVGLGLLWESVLIAGSGIGGGFYLLSSRNASERLIRR